MIAEHDVSLGKATQRRARQRHTGGVKDLNGRVQRRTQPAGVDFKEQRLSLLRLKAISRGRPRFVDAAVGGGRHGQFDDSGRGRCLRKLAD